MKCREYSSDPPFAGISAIQHVPWFFLLFIPILSLPAFDFLPYQKTDKNVYVTRIGRNYLKDADLVAEVRVGRISHFGMGVDVVTVKLEKIHFNKLPPPLSRKKEHLVLAHPKEFVKGTRLLLVMKRFGSNERMSVMDRISSVDANYTEKIRLMREYIAIEMLPGKEKLKALVSFAMRNLEDESFWVVQNCLNELRDLLKRKAWSFTTGDVKYLKRVEDQKVSIPLKRSLADFRKVVAAVAVEGPSLLDGSKDKKADNGEEETPEQKSGG